MRPIDKELDEALDSIRSRLISDLLGKVDAKLINDLANYFERNVDPQLAEVRDAIERQTSEQLQHVTPDVIDKVRKNMLDQIAAQTKEKQA